MRIKLAISILILFLFSINLFGQEPSEVITPKYKRVSQAYGYLLGQDYTLNLIKQKYPKQYDLHVVKAQLAFKSRFGKTKEGLKSYLKNYLGEEKFIEYEKKIINQLDELLSTQTITEEIAVNFILEVENRSKGKIDSPVLETLLSFQFADKPHDEFLEGFTTTFGTKGHPKSKNTDWQIRVPKSWKPQQSNRPNVIEMFTSDFGSGQQHLLLMVKEIPLAKGEKFTNEDLNDIFSEKEIITMIPEGGEFVSFQKMTIDKNIGGMLVVEQIVPRLDQKFKSRMAQFMFIRENKMYFLQGIINTEDSKEDLTQPFEKYYPLFRLVANSIVENSQYN